MSSESARSCTTPTGLRRARTEIRLTNDADLPLRLSAASMRRTCLLPRPNSFGVVIPPNSVELIAVEVSADETLNVDDLPLMTLRWRGRYTESEEKLPTGEGNASLVVSRIYDLPRRSQAAVVDGDLFDWDELPFDIRTPGRDRHCSRILDGPEDCSLRFAVEYDDDRLYIAVDVTDDRKIYQRAVAWSQDGIEVRLDGSSRPDALAQSRSRRGAGHYRRQS